MEVTKRIETMGKRLSYKEAENAVLLSADLFHRFYVAPTTPGNCQEVAGVIIEEAVAMEKWLVEKYGKDDEEYLDRLEEYEKILEEKYELPVVKG